MTDPIDNIQWRATSELKANDYNPNVVITPELRLLEFSILKTGWIQPVLVDPDDNIIDGFHRWSLTRDSKALQERYDGKLPVAVIDCTRAEAMMLTIRINRAKGTHIAIRMSQVVRELIDVHGVSPDDVAKEIGAGRKEVDLLYQENMFKARDIKNAKYSVAWEPDEGTPEEAAEALKGKDKTPAAAPVDGEVSMREIEWEETQQLRAHRGKVPLQKTQKTTWWGLFVADQLVAFVGFIYYKPGACRLKGAVTHSDFRRRGYYQQLMKQGMAQAEANGVTQFEGIARHPKALLQLGFTQYGERHGTPLMRRNV